MQKVELNNIIFKDWNHIEEHGEPVSKKWGKTFFYYDETSNKLFAETFSIIGRLLRIIFGYKKEFNKENLWKYLGKVHVVKSDENCPANKLFRQTVEAKLQKFCESKQAYFDNVLRPRTDARVLKTDDELIQLFENGLDVNVRSEGHTGGRAPLFEATRAGRTKLVNYLLEHGADTKPIYNTFVCSTALGHAVFDGYEEIFFALLEHGADATITTRDGDTMLHFACGGQHGGFKYAGINKKIVAALIKAGTDVNACDGNGKTPLYHAVERKDKEAVQLLLEAGATLEIAEDRENPLVPAIIEDQPDMVTLLLEKGAVIEPQAIRFAAEHKSDAILKQSIARGATLDKGDKKGSTPLMEVASGNKLEAVKRLIAHGASVNIPDVYGETALHKAVKLDHFDIAKVLIAAGADPTLKAVNTQSAHDCARTPQMRKMLKEISGTA